MPESLHGQDILSIVRWLPAWQHSMTCTGKICTKPGEGVEGPVQNYYILL